MSNTPGEQTPASKTTADPAPPTTGDGETRTAYQGAAFLGVFGLAWAVGGTIGAMTLPPGIVAGIVIGAGLLVATLGMRLRRIATAMRDPPQPVEHHRRRFRQINVAQGLAIALVVVGLGRTGYPQYIPPAIVLVVGLHFLPLARVFGVPEHRAIGGWLSTVAALGLASVVAAGAEAGQAVAGIGAAAVLWTGAASFLIDLRGHTPQRQ